MRLSTDDHRQAVDPTSSVQNESDNKAIANQYPVVALGGTFDHLHAGHKILLSMGAWLASRKLIVGVTGKSSSRNPLLLDF